MAAYAWEKGRVREWQERMLGTTEHFPRRIEPEKGWSGRKADMKASWELGVENALNSKNPRALWGVKES